jgi:hypothetical protein
MLHRFVGTQGCTYNKPWPNSSPITPPIVRYTPATTWDTLFRSLAFIRRGVRHPKPILVHGLHEPRSRVPRTIARTATAGVGGRPYCVGRLHWEVVDLSATAAAGLAVVLIGIGLLAMGQGSFAPAGASFLSASLVIYIREAYLAGN